MNDPPVCSGYDATNMASIDKRFLCPTCRLIFRDPVQLACGHRICHFHLPWEDRVVVCPECSATTIIAKSRSDKGLINDMQTLHIDCSLCQWSGQFNTYQHHLEQSHNQYRCSYCNEIFDSVTVLDRHTQNGCPYAPVNCILESYGCKKQILRCHLPKHYRSEEHQRILLLLVLPLIVTMTTDNRQLTTMNTHINQQMIELPNKITTTISTPLVTDEFKVHQEHMNETIDILHDGIKVLSDELQQISDESLQQSQLVKTTDQTLTTLKISHEESNAGFNAMNTNLILLQQECVSLKQTIEERQFISYDGTLVWRITNVQEKMAEQPYRVDYFCNLMKSSIIVDAQSERQVSIYSPPFYSSPCGYKMCARLYLFGDGNARRTHMSLFFVLMRSENDSLLKFPFSYKVIFCLFDQSGQQKHIVDSFRPDIKSNSFQRPRCHMNIASGIPKFVPLSTIQQPDNPYVRADTMFIKIMVDFGNLPKTILPYAMSLNPGIPTNYKQKMIQQEIERQTQVTSHKEVINSNAFSNNQQQFDSDNTMKE